ncbi:hypothetical protein ACR2XN_29085, partial [Klebsiella pneumoniae]
DELEKALFGTDMDKEEFQRYQELVRAYQEAYDREEDADILLVSKDKYGGSTLSQWRKFLLKN